MTFLEEIDAVGEWRSYNRPKIVPLTDGQSFRAFEWYAVREDIYWRETEPYMADYESSSSSDSGRSTPELWGTMLVTS